MAYILSKVGQSFNVPIHIYEADTEEDMNTIDIQSIPMGSKCHIINNGKWYMLNSERKWKAVSRSGGGIQSDWNQNDATQPDYVKNRPFYTGDPVETVLVEESTVTFEDAGGIYVASFPTTFEATGGETYKVSWDGTVYECTCVDADGALIIGNLSIVGEGSDTGEPFVMGIVNVEEVRIFTVDTSASHTFSISANISPITKIDEKYLPEDSPYLSKYNPTGSGSFSLNRKPDSEIGEFSFAEGDNTTASGNYSHAEGQGTTASGQTSHAEGEGTIASGYCSHTEGVHTTASSNYSHAEGIGSKASGAASHAEGSNTTASGEDSHAEGYSSNIVPTTITSASTNDEIVAEWNTRNFTLAKGQNSHAEGRDVLALGNSSHAEGYITTASGVYSHAEGYSTTASGGSSHAEGLRTTASGNYSHVQGKYNIEDSSNLYAHIVGNGTSTKRSNAHTLDWSGNAWFAGDVYVRGSDQSSGEKLLTKKELPKPIAQLVTLSASEWDADTKSQTITVFGVLADEGAQLVTPTPLTTGARAYINAGVALTGREDNMVTFTAETIPTEDIKLYVVRQEIELGDCLAFSSPEPFSIKVSKPGWRGTMEYSTDANNWTTWRGESISAVENNGKYSLYFRGTGNTVVTGGYDKRWSLFGSNISCMGNIETLLDYDMVASEGHPTMEHGCYNSMFYGCTSLTTAPSMPATKLTSHCYYNMFSGCTSLTTAPALPATTLADYCYNGMFSGCTSLTTAPALPATTLSTYCYSDMFRGCTSLTTAPALPATTLAQYCYREMFFGCTSLTTAPALPATTLADYCYDTMFKDCTSLTTAPALPATTLAQYCYNRMFYYCTSLTTAPALPATTLAQYCYREMFFGCTSLTTAPALPATTLKYNCYNRMFQGCTSLKLSPTQTEEYTIAYRIPSNGTGTNASKAVDSMFLSTGGTFTAGTPVINTTYYLHKDNSIVQ